MPDRRMGEKACAYVIPKVGESITLEEVGSFLSEKKVAKFKLPERIEVVGEFPTTPSGKIQKYLLRKDITQKIEMEERTKK
jgi:non-ribosomal peptide synthetase component E (peptide arylation enzyme)